MRKIIFGLSVMVIMMLGTTGIVKAEIIEYNFAGGSGDTGTSFDFSTFDSYGNEFITSVTGSYNNSRTPGDVVWKSLGLGLKKDPLDDTNLDGNYDEYLTFSFAKEMSLLEMNFEDAQGNDYFDFYADGDLKFLDHATTVGWQTTEFNGSTFTVRARGSDDSYLVSGMRLQVVNPEPTTLLLMGVGIVGLIGGATRKKLKKKAVVKS